MRRRTSSTFSGVSGTSPKRTSPASGLSRPTISRRSVDLPQPLGPSRTVVRPGGRVRSIGPTAALRPKRLEALRSSSTRKTPARERGIDRLLLQAAFAADFVPQLLRPGERGPLREQDVQLVLGL